MRILIVVAVLVHVGCGGPTAPTRTAVAPPVTSVPPPVATTPPPVVTPPVILPPTPPFPPTDPRFDLTFYRAFVHNAHEGPLRPLLRQREAPRIYLRTIDDAGAPIDSVTLNDTAVALADTAGLLTGVFGLAGIERGTEHRRFQPGWINVSWAHYANEDGPNRSICGMALIGGSEIVLYPKSRFCRCGGGPAVVLSIVKHELGHALGFHHTDNRNDLMYPTYNACNQQPSPREIYHASVAYQRPIGSPAP